MVLPWFGRKADDCRNYELAVRALRQLREGTRPMRTQTVIEIAAGDVAAELSRQGISPDERVTLTIEPDLFPGRRESRKLVIAAGLTDDDIDRLIERAREDVALHRR
jgi:hypothetical protein